MKKWGALVTAVVMLALGLALLLPAQASTSIYANSTAHINVSYSDNHLIREWVDVSAEGRATRPSPLQFPQANSDNLLYNGAGAFVSSTGAFRVRFGAGQTPHIVSQQRWVLVDRIDPIPAASVPSVTVGDEIDYTLAFINAAEVHEVTTVVSNASEDGLLSAFFNIVFTHQGVYRVRIFTGPEDQPPYVNTFIIVARIQPPVNFFAEFHEGSTREMSRTVVMNRLSDAQIRGAEPIALLSFHPLPGFENAGAFISGQSPYFMTPRNMAYEDRVDFVRFVHEGGGARLRVYLIPDRPVTMGDYHIRFTMQFTPQPRISEDGVALAALASENTRDLYATIVFTQSQGWRFPWLTLLICAGILTVLALGYFGCSWLVKYSSTQGAAQAQQSRAKRTKTDQENLEKLREQVRIQQEQEEALAKVKKSSKPKKTS